MGKPRIQRANHAPNHTENQQKPSRQTSQRMPVDPLRVAANEVGRQNQHGEKPVYQSGRKSPDKGFQLYRNVALRKDDEMWGYQINDTKIKFSLWHKSTTFLKIGAAVILVSFV